MSDYRVLPGPEHFLPGCRQHGDSLAESEKPILMA